MHLIGHQMPRDSRVANIVTCDVVVEEKAQADVASSIVGDIHQKLRDAGVLKAGDDAVDLGLEVIEIIRAERAHEQLRTAR